jgi:hypothetical protein
MLCPIRIPDVLQARIDAVAGKGKRSAWILEACRIRLDKCEPGGATVAVLEKIPVDPLASPICGKMWWEDGERYECLMEQGHLDRAHGVRGMVRRVEQ